MSGLVLQFAGGFECQVRRSRGEKWHGDDTCHLNYLLELLLTHSAHPALMLPIRYFTTNNPPIAYRGSMSNTHNQAHCLETMHPPKMLIPFKEKTLTRMDRVLIHWANKAHCADTEISQMYVWEPVSLCLVELRYFYLMEYPWSEQK